MSTQLGVLLAIALFCGAVAGSIGYSRIGTTGAFVGLFILGFVLPLIGIIVACFVRAPAPPPQPPDWYPDPWRVQPLRWWDGYQWTWHTR